MVRGFPKVFRGEGELHAKESRKEIKIRIGNFSLGKFGYIFSRLCFSYKNIFIGKIGKDL